MFGAVPRAAFRSSRPIRVARPQAPRRSNVRFQSTNTGAAKSDATQAAQNHTPAVVGGIVGGSVVVLLGYTWYHFSGLKTVSNTVSQTKSYIDKAFKKSTEAAPEPNEALKWLRQTVTSYAAFIPGAQQYVDTAFDDIDKIREKHGGEVDQIVKETYDELKDVTKKGANFESFSQAWQVLQNAIKRIGSLAGDASEDILNNHPQLKEKFGGSIGQLKNMGEQYGPEAKKQLDETWQQVSDILKGGLSYGTYDKLQKLIQEKTEQMKKYGDQAWEKGIQEAKPYLDKQPELKETLEKNKSKLLKGDLGQLWKQLQEVGKSGDTGKFKDFVKEQVGKADSSVGGGLEQYLKMLPGGAELGPKLQQLQQLTEKHGKEAEQLVKSAIDDVKKVLEKKVEEGQKLKDKAEKDVKQ